MGYNSVADNVGLSALV